MTTAEIGSLTRRLAGEHAGVGRAQPVRDVDQLEPTEFSVRAHIDETTLTAEQVAGIVAGIPAIGKACEALISAGWRTGIAGNRITVNDEVFAQFIGAHLGRAGGVEAAWVIYAIAGAAPVWVVGAEPCIVGAEALP
jgi:hypothetical protein